jgi:putative protease
MAFGANAGLRRPAALFAARAQQRFWRISRCSKQGIDHPHSVGGKFFWCPTSFPHGNKTKNYLTNMAPVIALKPDAMIMSDPGLIMMVRETWPEMEIHLSVQANTVNAAAVKFWKSVGISRVILSRELSLDQVEQIRQDCPDTELEVFVHGALCIAYSGRCLLSGYFNHRDANQGSLHQLLPLGLQNARGHCRCLW